jgi:hypothetical protein
VAAAVWVRRRAAGRPALPERSGAIPPPAPPARPAAPPRARPHTRTGRFDRRPSGRFARRGGRGIDIVTVVDDLLGSAR